MEIEQSEITWQFLCRICLQSTSSDMKCIFDDVLIATDVVTKIINCGGVPVEIMDGFPDRICDQCLNNLEIAFKFRNTCQESYSQLLAFASSKEDKEDVVKLEIESEMEFVKLENIENDPVSLQEPKLRRESDSSYSPENSLEVENMNQVSADVSKEPKKIDSSPIKNEKKYQKPKAKSRREKNGCKPGRKPNPNPSNKHICHICGNIYTKQARLSDHIRRHTEGKVHACEICGKKFFAAAEIPRHMNTHTGNRPYQCSFCPSRFGDASTRNKHQRIHTNERPYKCTECGKAFAYTNVLKVHMTIHSGERPYSCSVCGKGFSQKHHQQSHERTHSNINVSKL